MPRRVQHSQESLMFPAWSASAEDLANGQILSGRRRRECKVWVRRAILFSAVVAILWIVIGRGSGNDGTLNNMLSESECKELGMTPFQRRVMRMDNPWRGAGRHARKDVIMSVSGCGGSLRNAISIGDNVSVRYSIRSADGKLLDRSKGAADVLVGAGQVDEEIEGRLQGVCRGEAVRFQTRDGRMVLLYIEGIGSAVKNSRALEDKLARLVKTVSGRKGRSCKSTCVNAGLVCEEKGLVVVNNCPRLREAFGCRRCEIAAAGSSGADMPALVVKSAPIGHARGGCLVTPHAASSTCDAKYAYTRRLCPCFEQGVVQRVMEMEEASA